MTEEKGLLPFWKRDKKMKQLEGVTLAAFGQCQLCHYGIEEYYHYYVLAFSDGSTNVLCYHCGKELCDMLDIEPKEFILGGKE